MLYYMYAQQTQILSCAGSAFPLQKLVPNFSTLQVNE